MRIDEESEWEEERIRRLVEVLSSKPLLQKIWLYGLI